MQNHRSRLTSFRASPIHARPFRLLLPLFTGVIGIFMLFLPLAVYAQDNGDRDLYVPNLEHARAAPPTMLIIDAATTLTQDIDVDIFIIRTGVTVTVGTDITSARGNRFLCQAR